ncbi:MAG: PqqD family protein [Clostridia bacterium]|nr:PqqD family protein [Oscillospiraceae bacterium]MDY5627408.1 PqqD family protein [Clostridia bacterium]
MKVKEGFIVKKVIDDYVVVPVGDNFMDFSSIINLNETGAFLWQCMENDITEDELVNLLSKEYEVDASEVKDDVADFIESLKNAKLLSE